MPAPALPGQGFLGLGTRTDLRGEAQSQIHLLVVVLRIGLKMMKIAQDQRNSNDLVTQN